MFSWLRHWADRPLDRRVGPAVIGRLMPGVCAIVLLAIPSEAQVNRFNPLAADLDPPSRARLAFERAQPEQAMLLLDRYLTQQPQDAGALLAAGEIDLACFRDGLARDRLERALRIAPAEASVLRACARAARTPIEEVRLLARYISESVKSSRDPTPDLEDAVAHMEMHQLIGDSESWSVASTAPSYRLPMAALNAGGGVRIGYGLPVSINGEKPLRLLVDSGGTDILISERRAKSLHLRYFAEGRITGVASREAAATRLGIADTVAIGHLVFHNAVVQVTRGEATADQEGLIGLEAFSPFLIGFDLRHGRRELTLQPLPEAPAAAPKESIDVVRLKHLLLVRALLDSHMDGYFVFDTGAAFSAIDSRWAERIPAARMSENPVEMKTATGFLSVNRWRMPAGMLVAGGRPFETSEVISLDLSRFSKSQSFQVAGLIGLSSLEGSLITLNYRDGTVSFERP